MDKSIVVVKSHEKKFADIKVKEPSLESLCRLAIATYARVTTNILNILTGEVFIFASM